MDKNLLFNELRDTLENKLIFLDCKPEETAESTLKALWMTAYGAPCSTYLASSHALPPLTSEQASLLKKLISRRLENEPLSYITGRQSFMGIELLTNRQALIPRKETEILGNKALNILKEVTRKNKNSKVFDLGCGSGNLGLALASLNPDIEVYSSDISNEAVLLTKKNINHLNLSERVSVSRSDMFESFRDKRFFNKISVIVCNPPYISTGKVPKMDLEISSNEPREAFDGGIFGLSIIQRLIRESPEFLIPKIGWLLFEVGAGQGEMILKLCQKSQLYDTIETVSDSSSVIRVLYMRNK